MPVQHCRDCGYDNPEQERYCQACNSDLDHYDIVSGNVTERQTKRYRILESAADKAIKGEYTLEEFLGILDESSAIFHEKAQALLATVEEFDYQKDSPEEVETGLEGLRSFEQGLHEMYQYANDQDPQHLKKGLESIWSGNEKVLSAMRLNREYRQNMIEELTRLHEDL